MDKSDELPPDITEIQLRALPIGRYAPLMFTFKNRYTKLKGFDI